MSNHDDSSMAAKRRRAAKAWVASLVGGSKAARVNPGDPVEEVIDPIVERLERLRKNVPYPGQDG